MRLKLLAIALATATLATPAFACNTKGSPDAELIGKLPDPSDKAFYRALAAATQPATLAKVQAQPACMRNPRQLSGENSDPFPRVLKQGPRIGYLAPLPMLGADGKKKTVYAIVHVWGSGAVRVDGLMTGVPEDIKLRRVMMPGYNGGFEPLEFDEKTGLIVDKNFYLAADIKREYSRNASCFRDPACGAPLTDEPAP